MDTLDFIIAYEDGDIETPEQVYAGFQQLINSGLAWQLQGHYGRTAAQLIQQGRCTPKRASNAETVIDDQLNPPPRRLP